MDNQKERKREKREKRKREKEKKRKEDKLQDMYESVLNCEEKLKSE